MVFGKKLSSAAGHHIVEISLDVFYITCEPQPNHSLAETSSRLDDIILVFLLYF